jgi:hypothetical protein
MSDEPVSMYWEWRGMLDTYGGVYEQRQQWIVNWGAPLRLNSSAFSNRPQLVSAQYALADQ